MSIGGPSVVFPAKAQIDGEVTSDLDVVLTRTSEYSLMRQWWGFGEPFGIRRLERFMKIVGRKWGAATATALEAAAAHTGFGHICLPRSNPVLDSAAPNSTGCAGVLTPARNECLPWFQEIWSPVRIALLDALGGGEEIPSCAPRSPLRSCGNPRAADDRNQRVFAIARGGRCKRARGAVVDSRDDVEGGRTVTVAGLNRNAVSDIEEQALGGDEQRHSRNCW